MASTARKTKPTASSSRSSGNYAARRFHEEWLGLVQPSEGLVVSIPVLIEADCWVRRRDAELARRLLGICAAMEQPDVQDIGPEVDAANTPIKLKSVRGLLTKILEIPEEFLHEGDQLPEAIELTVQDGQQTIRPSFGILRPPAPLDAEDEEVVDLRALKEDEKTPASEAALAYEVLGWSVDPSLDLDKAETTTGDWHFPPVAKFERMLRHARVPIGVLTNRREVRLVYAPHGEAAGSLSFRLQDMVRPTGRPILDAMVMLLGQKRLIGDVRERRLPQLLKESRSRQADVTEALAKQLLEGLSILLRGFELAAVRDGADLEAQVDPEREADGVYQGLLTVLLRLVFALYAEDRRLLPIDHPHYSAHLSVMGLYEKLLEDAGRYPDSMDSRFGAWDRLLALFRAIYAGADHGDLHLSPRNGDLFDPTKFGFLECWQEFAADEFRPSPSVDDGTVFSLLKRLLVLDGQRLSYRSLDVEQIGSVYEALMGYHVVRLSGKAVCLKPKGVWVMPEEVKAQKGAQRGKWVKVETGLSKAQADKVAKACTAGDGELMEVLDGFRMKGVDWCDEGRFVIQPGVERRRTSSHYTPRELSEPIVEKTLRPLIATMGDDPGSEMIMRLKVCDPAMGSGAFLVAACRYLGDQVVAAWQREGVIGEIQATKGEPVDYARRLVAQRCLYGVDKNAYAVQLAKLSLWLVTMGADLPLTFVDHALRCGDSLVGLDLGQIAGFHWKRSPEPVAAISKVVEAAIGDALRCRKEILSLAESGLHLDHANKRRLLWDASDAMERVQLIGDLVIGAFFAEKKDKAREKERLRRLALVEAWLEGDGPVTSELKGLQEEVRKTVVPLHWGTEFVEVFYEGRKDVLDNDNAGLGARMDAVVGNPPFLGGKKISGLFGDAYLNWTHEIHPATQGKSDLCAQFFRRVEFLIGTKGGFGLLATNTICQGDTRESGLLPMINSGFAIHDATKNLPWPGSAAVHVAVVHAQRGIDHSLHNEAVFLDSVQVDCINSRLRPKPERPAPRVIAKNVGLAYLGSKVYGQGFLLTPEEKDRLIAMTPENSSLISPYLGGKEVNTSPTQSHSRYAINFGDMTLDEARRWPELLNLVETKVKPEREKLKRKCLREKWWHYGERQPALYKALAGLNHCIVTAWVSKHLIFTRQPTGRVFSLSLVVFPRDDFFILGILQSRIHEIWVRVHSSSLKSELRYCSSDCLNNFPFPDTNQTEKLNKTKIEKLARELEAARREITCSREIGLTTLYNLAKKPSRVDKEIAAIQDLHQALDTAVLEAYGWQDLDAPQWALDCPENSRFKEAVLDRLFSENLKQTSRS